MSSAVSRVCRLGGFRARDLGSNSHFVEGLNREFVGVEEGSHFLVLRSGIGVLCILQVFIDVCVYGVWSLR